MILCIPMVYLISKKLYKKGVITVDMPEEAMETAEALEGK